MTEIRPVLTPRRRLGRRGGALLMLIGVACLTGACASKEPDRANALPFGHMDGPPAGSSQGRSLVVAGWALDDSAVARVNIYVDGHYTATTAPQTVARPDVAKAFPSAPHSEMAGWQVTVDLGDLTGVHTILAQAVDDKGATADLGSAAVTLTGLAN